MELDKYLILESTHSFLSALEVNPLVNTREKVYEGLRQLCLNDFGGVLWSFPIAEFPRISLLMPTMSSKEIQKQWTGATGANLLDQSISFVRSFAENFARYSGTTLCDKAILDFGCGYGRFQRLFRYYSDELWGVDCWQKSLDECEFAGIKQNLRLTDQVPSQLNLPICFDAGFAFSVFTHLSATCAQACLKAIHKSMKPGGIFCATIRPIEFWKEKYFAKPNLDSLLSRHRNDGYAFLTQGSLNPINCQDSDGYGNTSMSLEFLASIASGWEILGIDRSINDPLQTYVFMRAL